MGRRHRVLRLLRALGSRANTLVVVGVSGAVAVVQLFHYVRLSLVQVIGQSAAP